MINGCREAYRIGKALKRIRKADTFPNGISIVRFCQQNGIVYSQQQYPSQRP